MFLQALLARTLGDYRKAGYDCKSSSLEIRLIQSQDDIRNPEVKYHAERYNWLIILSKKKNQHFEQ